MKEYLKALNSLQRMCDLVDKGADLQASTFDYYLEDFIRMFEGSFGGLMGVASKLEIFNAARGALQQHELNKAVKLIRSANVFA